MEFAYGHLLDIGRTGQINQYRFQNYAVGQNVGNYSFLPFSFGGAMASFRGDNLDATLQFANTQVSRNFVVEALDNSYVAKVTTILWNTSTYATEKTLYEYFGACASGGWDEVSIQVKLNSVLDAVQANIPGRRLYQQQVGKIPFTAQVDV